jgi:hypothetical protein
MCRCLPTGDSRVRVCLEQWALTSLRRALLAWKA